MKASLPRILNRLKETTFWPKLLFILGILMNISFLLSLKYGFLNHLLYDTSYTKGNKEGDFYGMYQAGNNLLHNIIIYETDSNKIHYTAAFNPFRYLTSMALVGVFLNIFNSTNAYWFWIFFLEILLAVGIYLAWQITEDKTRFYFAGSMWLLFTPFYPELYMFIRNYSWVNFPLFRDS